MVNWGKEWKRLEDIRKDCDKHQNEPRDECGENER